MADSYDDPFSADDVGPRPDTQVHISSDELHGQDDAFGPFSDSAAASGADPFTFSPSISEDLEDAAGFDSFGNDFGEFHAAGDGETTPTAESWSFTSVSSGGLTDSAEDFGLGPSRAAAPAQAAAGGRGRQGARLDEDTQMEEAPRTAGAR